VGLNLKILEEISVYSVCFELDATEKIHCFLINIIVIYTLDVLVFTFFFCLLELNF